MAASYLTSNVPGVSPQAATAHGDTIAFVFLAAVFAAGAVVTALGLIGARTPVAATTPQPRSVRTPV